MSNHKQSHVLYEEAQQYIPGGVNSPVRAFRSVGLDPIFVDHAHGSQVWDVDGNQYTDMICSWGPLILGHSPECLVSSMEEWIKKGTSYGLPTKIEVDMAKLIVEAYPAIDEVRMVNSGTEATMSALRVARAYTKRNKILKFAGCYHGHSDALLVQSGSGALTYGVPTSPGVPNEVVQDTLVLPYNDISALEALFAKVGSEIAAVILEPVSGNMGVIPAEQAFIERLRSLTKEYGTVLIFDEVITGFRLGYHSAPAYFGVEPDMACFGKIIGAGLPVGAYGGKKEIMQLVSPVGPVYQAGTLSGNPLAMHMGKRNLEILRDHPEIYTYLEERATQLQVGIQNNLDRLHLPYTVQRAGSLVCLFFAEGPIRKYEDVQRCNIDIFNAYFKEMLSRGFLLAPTQFEAMFLSAAHTEDDIAAVIAANYESLKAIH